jgi:hypothetical protein
VREQVTVTSNNNEKHCVTCRCYQRKYPSNAERQRAYRDRHKDK